MTVNTAVRQTDPFIGDDVTTTLPFAFKVFTDADLLVVRTDEDGVDETLTLNSDYTVTRNANQNTNPGGEVELADPLASDFSVVITTDIAATQGASIPNNSAFFATIVENALDKLTILYQQLSARTAKALRFPVSDGITLSQSTLPGVAERAGSYLAFDGDGLPVIASGTGADSALRTDIAASTGASLVGAIYSGTGAAAFTVQALIRAFGISAAQWGVPIDGTEGGTQMASLLAAHTHIYLPPGDYKISTKQTYRTGTKIVGAGRLSAIITSGVIGDSLFTNAGSYTGFVYMSDFQMIGNDLTGASGNGHAINMIDPAIGSGSFTPAQCVMERLYIRKFRGLDVRDNSATAVGACAIICVDGLGNVFRDISVENCGHGIFLHRTQNVRIENPLITGCAGWGVHSYDTENTIVYDGDVNTCGTDGTTNTTGYLEAGMGTGNVLSARDEGFLWIGGKVKGSPGTAQVHAYITSAEITSNWIRADHEINKGYTGILVTDPVDVSIHDNDFSPTSGSAYSLANGGSAKITSVKVSVSSTHNIAKVRVNDNQFRQQGGTATRAHVHFVGASSATRFEGQEISGNNFGMPLTVATAATVDTDVLFDTGMFANNVIRGNNHQTRTNVTKTAHYELTGGTYLYNDFDCNSFSSEAAGQIAGTFSGFLPGLESISAAKTFALGDGNRTFLHPSADTTARTWQIPANATAPYAIGTKFTIINQDSAGVLTLAVVTDTLRLAGAGTTGNRSLAANGRAVLEKLTATEWIISGTGIT